MPRQQAGVTQDRSQATGAAGQHGPESTPRRPGGTSEGWGRPGEPQREGRVGLEPAAAAPEERGGKEGSRSKTKSSRCGCHSQAAHPQSWAFTSVPQRLLWPQGYAQVRGEFGGASAQRPPRVAKSALPSSPQQKGPAADAGPKLGRLGICKAGVRGPGTGCPGDSRG